MRLSSVQCLPVCHPVPCRAGRCAGVAGRYAAGRAAGCIDHSPASQSKREANSSKRKANSSKLKQTPSKPKQTPSKSKQNEAN